MNNGGMRRITILALVGCSSLGVPGLMYSGTSWSSAKPVQEPVQLEDAGAKVAEAAVLVLPDTPPSSPRAASRSPRLSDVPGEQEVLVAAGSGSPKNSVKLNPDENDRAIDCEALALIAARYQSQQAAAQTSPSLSSLNPDGYDVVPGPRKVLAMPSSAETTPAVSPQQSPSLSLRHLVEAAILAKPLFPALEMPKSENAQVAPCAPATQLPIVRLTKSKKRRERKRKASLSASQELIRSQVLSAKQEPSCGLEGTGSEEYCPYNYCSSRKAACTEPKHAILATFGQQQ